MDVGVVVPGSSGGGRRGPGGFLGGGGVIEINERMPVDPLVEDGKIGAEGGPVDGSGRFGDSVHEQLCGRDGTCAKRSVIRGQRSEADGGIEGAANSMRATGEIIACAYVRQLSGGRSN